MNVITVSNFDQLNLVFNDLVCLSGEQSEEIFHNMWCIALDGDFIESITLKELKHFVDTLIKNREQQLKNVNFCKNAVFYMWFDQQALQLRFNIITGDSTLLPFECKLRLHITFESVLNNFINIVKNIAQNGDQIKFFNDEDWENEDENEDEYILDVFVKTLRGDIKT